MGCGFTGTNGNDDEQAGTFMHELGHNLNLRHGGFTGAGSSNYNMACKPNYLSVMSYSRQMSSGGFLSATQWNALAGDHENSLDYSRYGSPGTAGTPTIPDLTESSLIENNGLVTSDGKKYYIPWTAPGGTTGTSPALGTPPTIRTALSGATINWDGDSSSAETVGQSVDMNAFYPHHRQPSPYRLLSAVQAVQQ